MVPLQTLLEHGQNVVAVAMEADDTPAAQDRRIPILSGNPQSIANVARLHGLPLIDLSGHWSRSLARISSYSPDIIVVSCFARKLPDSVLSIPAMGCFNLHPSLLPAYRGPVPLFWQFRAGVEEFGITLHRMSAQIDAGNIVGQTRLVPHDGLTVQRASVLLAEAGGELLARTLTDSGRDRWLGVPQDDRYASYQGFPSPSDYAVSVSWSARRLDNFICATRDRGTRYPCLIDNQVYPLLEAESWQEEAVPRAVIKGNTITFPCRDGSVTARFEAD